MRPIVRQRQTVGSDGAKWAGAATRNTNSLSLRALRKEFRAKGGGRVVGLAGMDISLSAGEMLVLLGPSGCGKSTTLRCVAGLETPDEGQIAFGETLVFDAGKRVDVPSEQRDIGMVFQNFALWPHMTVRQIVEFPLKTRKLRRPERESRVETSLCLVDCEELADRYPGQLSGGQQQRVALARALVARPTVLLFDEPLSNLDAGLRSDLRGEIRRLHRAAGFTGIYVTHDQVEALAVADRIAVMRLGQIVQIGAPRDIYEQPANEWVAGFMGFTNRLPASSDRRPDRDGAAGDRSGIFRFRPEAVSISTLEEGRPDSLVFRGEITDVAFIGSGYEYHVMVGDTRLEAIAPAELVSTLDLTLEPGLELEFVVAGKDVLTFADGETERSAADESRAGGESTTTDLPAAVVLAKR